MNWELIPECVLKTYKALPVVKFEHISVDQRIFFSPTLFFLINLITTDLLCTEKLSILI